MDALDSTPNDTFDRIVTGFYQAAGGAIGWQDALVPFQRAVEAHSVHLHGVDVVAGRVAFSHAATDTPPEAELDYVRTYYRIDPRAALVLALEAGQWINCWEHFDEDFVACDPFYQDFLIPYGGRYVSGTKVLQHDSVSVVLGVHRGHGSPVLNSDELALCKRLVRHLADALTLHRDLIARRDEGRLGTTLLSRLRAPIVLLDERRQLHHANPAAQALLSATDAICVRDRYFHCQRPDDDDALLTTLRSLLSDGQTPADAAAGKRGFLRAGSASSSATLGLYLHALRPDDTLYAFSTEPLAMMLIHDRQARLSLDPFIVASAFGLTPAEARVAVATAEGAAPESIAVRHRASIHTVRSQLQSVLQKTGTTRQAEMVGLLARLPSAAPGRSKPC